jgi:hypothetical protein
MLHVASNVGISLFLEEKCDEKEMLADHSILISYKGSNTMLATY